MAQGVVKWFNDSKGYGFISQSSGEDVFVHHSAIVMDGYRTLKEGQSVSFDVTREKKGWRAANVRVISANVTTKVKTVPKVSIPAPSTWLPPSTSPKRSLPVRLPPKPAPKSVQLSPLPICVEEMTPLMLAAQAGDIQQVEALLVSGVNPNAQEQRGVTALMFAVCRGNIGIIEALLRAGANPNIEAFTGDTALTIAHDRKQKCCIGILSQAARLHKRFKFSPVNKPSRNPIVNQQKGVTGVVFDNFCEERWESSEGLAYMRRDGGQFGSFPLHEDYGDEGQVDSPRDNEWYDR